MELLKFGHLQKCKPILCLFHYGVQAMIINNGNQRTHLNENWCHTRLYLYLSDFLNISCCTYATHHQQTFHGSGVIFTVMGSCSNLVTTFQSLDSWVIACTHSDNELQAIINPKIIERMSPALIICNEKILYQLSPAASYFDGEGSQWDHRKCSTLPISCELPRDGGRYLWNSALP